ncbi:MAG: ATP-binding protein [Trueperaceae bacterium]
MARKMGLMNSGEKIGETRRESEVRLRLVLEAAQIGEWDLDLETGRANRSRIHDQIFGYDQMLADWTYDIFLNQHVHPDDRAFVDRAFKHTLATHEDWDFNCRIFRTDDQARWIWARGTVYLDAGGKAVRLLGLVQDITERKVAEARDQFLISLNAALRPLDDPNEITTAATRLLGTHLDVDRCVYAEVEKGETRFAVQGEYERGDTDQNCDCFSMSAWGETALQAMREHLAYVVDDTRSDQSLTEAERAGYEKRGVRAVIAVSVHSTGRLVSALAVHQKTPRHWLATEVELTITVANRCWETVERARVTRDLRESEERYRTLVSSVDQGFCVIEVLFDENDRPVDYRFKEMNPLFEALTGLQDAAGRTARELVPGLEERWFEAYGQVALTGEPVRFTESSEAMSRWFDVYAFRVGGEDSREVALLFSNITERKRAEAERESLLRELELERSQLATIFREAPAMIATLRGPQHVFEMANPLYYQLVGRRELIGKSVREALPDVADQGFFELLDEVYGSGEPFVGSATRILLRHKPESPQLERFLDFVYQPMREADGSISGIFVHAVDVTEHTRAVEALAKARNEMEQRVEDRTSDLKALNAELESFNYSVSHDLRAPLRGIDGFSEVLLEDYRESLDETARGYLQRIRAGALRMGNLIDDLLNLSHMSTGSLKRRPINLSVLAESVAESLRAGDPQRDVAVIIEQGITANADENLLRIVLENLLGNSWKFTDKLEHTSIEFGVDEVNGQKVFLVRDTGAGFDMLYADKLFAPFQRVHSRDDFPGTGIGLAIVQRIIHRHGGTIWAESEVGNGANFYFTLA